MPRLRFLVVFFTLLLAFEIPLFIPAFDATVVKPFTQGITTISGLLLNAGRQNVQVSGTLLIGKCFAVDLKNGCNGLEATLFLMAAILAFPAAALRERAAIAIAGAAALQIANLIRVISLYLLGCYQRSWFEAFHLAVWQSLMFGLAVAMFMIWTRRVTALHVR